MRIGIFAGDGHGQRWDRGDRSPTAKEAAEQGFPSFWLPQIFGADAITVAGVIGREVAGIELGTAVVPTYPRHPMMLAQQALTANVLAGGRFTLGIGLSHQFVIEQIFKMSFDKPVRHMREYLSILRPLIHERSVVVRGRDPRRCGRDRHQGRRAVPDPRGRARAEDAGAGRPDGRGHDHVDDRPRTSLADHIVPTITGVRHRARPPEAPDRRGRADLRHRRRRRRAASASPPALVTYGFLPSYRAMLDRRGASRDPATSRLIGDEATVEAGLKTYADAGVDDLLAAELAITPTERTRTRDLLRSLL